MASTYEKIKSFKTGKKLYQFKKSQTSEIAYEGVNGFYI